MGYTAELNGILEELKDINEQITEERESDAFDGKKLRALVDKRTRLIFDRDILISNNKNGENNN